MTRANQLRFVREISRRILGEVCAHIRAGSVPEAWDGHELRRWLADKHVDSAGISTLMSGRSRRRREYERVLYEKQLYR